MESVGRFGRVCRFWMKHAVLLEQRRQFWVESVVVYLRPPNLSPVCCQSLFFLTLVFGVLLRRFSATAPLRVLFFSFLCFHSVSFPASIWRKRRSDFAEIDQRFCDAFFWCLGAVVVRALCCILRAVALVNAKSGSGVRVV